MIDNIDEIKIKARRQVAIGLYPNDFIVAGRVIGSINQAEAHLLQTIIDEHREMAEEILRHQTSGPYAVGYEMGRLAGIKLVSERIGDLLGRQQDEVDHLTAEPSTPDTQPL